MDVMNVMKNRKLMVVLGPVLGLVMFGRRSRWPRRS